MTGSSAADRNNILASRFEVKLRVKGRCSVKSACRYIKPLGKPVYCFFGNKAECVLNTLQDGDNIRLVVFAVRKYFLKGFFDHEGLSFCMIISPSISHDCGAEVNRVTAHFRD